MNTIILKRNLWLICLGLFFLFSCKEDEIKFYEGETNIFFLLKKWTASTSSATYSITDFPVEEGLYSDFWEIPNNAMDSITTSLAMDGTDKGYHVKLIPVGISGSLVDYDRFFDYTLGANSTAVEGEHFKVTAMIPANQRYGALAVSINRETVRDTILVVDFNLISSDNFQTNYAKIQRSSNDTTKVDMCQFRLRMSCFIEKPPFWDSNMAGYLGVYSQKKMLLILELTGGDIKIFYPEKSTQIVLGQIIAWGKLLKIYLNEQKAKDNTIYEADKVTVMTAGKYV